MGSKAIGLLTMVFGADMKGFNKAMTKAEKSLKKFSRNMKKAGRKMTQNLTMPILAIGGAAAKLSMDFDASMTKITTLVGIADSEVQKMKDSMEYQDNITASLFQGEKGYQDIKKNAINRLKGFS